MQCCVFLRAISQIPRISKAGPARLRFRYTRHNVRRNYALLSGCINKAGPPRLRPDSGRADPPSRSRRGTRAGPRASGRRRPQALPCASAAAAAFP
ncbi:hypothetical protein [Lysobacter gummosus]|uniref:hypothetical protein n=1 Tax=Lysobacter gummosus TaxID=262324 RepID=UPI00363847FA